MEKKAHFFLEDLPIQQEIDKIVERKFVKKEWKIEKQPKVIDGFVFTILDYMKKNKILPSYLKGESQIVQLYRIRAKIISLYKNSHLKYERKESKRLEDIKNSAASTPDSMDIEKIANLFNLWFCIYNQKTKDWKVIKDMEKLKMSMGWNKFEPVDIVYLYYNGEENGYDLLLKKNVVAKKCKPDEILNPATNRCVKKSGPTGKKLLGQQVEKKPKEAKTCKEDEILNPATNRCVKKSGPTGKKLLGQALVPVKKAKEPKKCKEDEIFNPVTERCVKRTGEIGKLLVLEEKGIIKKTTVAEKKSKKKMEAFKKIFKTKKKK